MALSEEFVVSMVFRGNDQMSRPASEMSRALKGLTADNRAVTQSSQDAGRGMSGFGNALKGAFAVLSIGEVKQFAEEFNDLGVQVRANRAIFEQLTGAWGDSEATLQKLRGATMGVVGDMTLMSGASQLLRLNIVENADDLERLTGQIMRLKQPTESMESAISNFSMMLANESKLRLDSFGISSANVTRRMEELGESFREATMYEMDASLERLGSAADVADTALGRLQTKLTNIAQQGASNFAVGVEAIVNGIDVIAQHAMGTLPSQQAEAAQMTAMREAGTLAAQEFLTGYRGEIDEGVQQALTQFAEAYAQQRNAAGAEFFGARDQVALMDLARSYGFNLPTDDPSNDLFRQLEFLADMTEEQRLRLSLTRAQEESEARLARVMEGASLMRDIDHQQFVEQQNEMRRAYPLNMMSALYSQMTDLYREGNGSLNGVTLFTDEQALQADAIRNEIDALATELKGLNDTDIISDAELEGAKQLASQAGDFANSIERGARELENMSLSGIFGQTGGGLMGEVGGLLLAEIRNSGVEGDALQEITDAIGLRSGMETEASLTFRDEILPMLTDIYTQFGTDAAVAAYAAYSEGIANATLSGRNLTPDMQMDFTGFQRTDGGGRQINVESGDNLYSLASRYGGSIEDYRGLLDTNGFLQPGEQSLGGGVERIAEMANATEVMAQNAPIAADSFSRMNQDVDVLQTGVGTVKGILDEIGATTYRVVVDLDVRYPGILDAILGGGGNLSTREAISQATRANGGRTPGSDTRTRTLER